MLAMKLGFNRGEEYGNTGSLIAQWEGNRRNITRQSIAELSKVMTLSTEEAAELLASAGFLPPDCEVISSEPLVVIELRTNEPLSEEAKRQVIDFVTAWKAQHFPSQ
jgi:hypothetical protein